MGAWALATMPFILLAVIGLVRVFVGPNYGLLPLLAVGPAAAAAVGGGLFTLTVGALAIGEAALIAFVLDPGTPQRNWIIAFLAIVGVSAGGAAASHIRRLRERELMDVRAVADVTQRVLLRPVPDRIGPLRLTVRYLSASTRARVGGDLYAAVPTPRGVLLIVGDAEGKGLTAVQEAATAMATFRAAAHQECTLAAVADRIEVTLDRELGDEQFITAVLAEVSPDGSKLQMINCGHPQPLLLSKRGPQFLGPEESGPPLGLGFTGPGERQPITVALPPGEPVLFYTDGLSEARNKAGEFFPVADWAAAQAAAEPSTILERLSAAVSHYVGHHPHDDMALLLIERTTP